GVFIIVSLTLGHFVNPLWYFFTAFVGLNLIQSAFTKWCLMEDILRSTVFRKQGYSGHEGRDGVTMEKHA
ncbi:MAG TPA: DUF2892 domain-containing protein, partial [Saprospiraceae bacterium]|nr:DUF2892 domain-containing protein [Saprospiraceae bacterium]